jgi:histone-lysine N-methyltransferase SETMAR
MGRISAKFVLRLLSDDQRAHRVSVCRELKHQARDDPNFISNIITDDETWVYGHDPETKQQSSQCNSPNSPLSKKKNASSSQQRQVHIDLFLDIQGIVQKEFISPGQTVKDKFYRETLKRLREGIGRKRPDKWKNSWFLHKDNSPAHTSLVFRQFLTFQNISVIPHSPIRLTSPPCDIFLFPKMKLRQKGRRFDMTEEIHAESHEVIDTLTFENFQGCMKLWKTRWDRCIHAQGDYFKTVETRSYGNKLFMVKLPEGLGSTTYIYPTQPITCRVPDRFPNGEGTEESVWSFDFIRCRW